MLLHCKLIKCRNIIYCMNNLVIVSHKDLFMHIDLCFPGSFHEVTFFRHLQ